MRVELFEDDPLSGTVTQISWDHPDLVEALKKLLRVKDNEIIERLVINNLVIKAVIKPFDS